MPEYLSKETLQEKLNRKKAAPATKRYTEGWNDAILMVKSMIHSEKAADVAPVRHGRWIFGKDLPYSWGQMPKNKYHLYCSECLEQAFNRSEDNDPDFDVDTPYCPDCGAKMDLEG